jgi:small-conductance mechanosensitive channel
MLAVRIGESLQEGFDAFFGFLPNILGFLVILLIGYFIARAVKAVVAKALERVGVDRTLHRSDAGKYVEKVSPGASPARLIGSLAFWFIFLFAISLAVQALDLPALNAFLVDVQNFLPNIIVAVLIFVVAAALAGAVAGVVHRLMGDTPTGKIVRAVAPGLILAIGTFMVLDQLQIAPVIVTITYAALIGALALAAALAFGLGGREVAGQALAGAVTAGQQRAGQVRQDMQVGQQRAQQQAEQAKQRAQSEAGAATGAASAQRVSPGEPRTVQQQPQPRRQ